MSIKVAALCMFRHNGKILVREHHSNGAIHFRPVGGSIEYGEHSKVAVQREVQEELGLAITEPVLLSVIENIFTVRGNDGHVGHEIDFIYESSFLDESVYRSPVITGIEDDVEDFQARWIPLEFFADREKYHLVPDGLYELLRKHYGLSMVRSGKPTFSIRLCEEMDLRQVIILSQLWADENITYGLEPNAIADLQSKIGGYFWIAEVGSQIVGYIVGKVHISDGLAVIPLGERYIEIDEVYVHLDHRSAGIGHQLVDKLLTEAESEGIKRSVLYSATKQWEEIVGFYEKHGFQIWFVEMYR